MKLSLLKMKTSSFLKKNKAIRVSLPYKQALSVGVIFSVEDKSKHDEIKDFVKRLEQDGKQVVVMSFLPQNKDNYEFMYDFFTEKDLTFWGTLTSNAALKFADMPFDLLYYIDTSPNPYILNLLARSKAKCRVGKFWESGTPYFEMMIENKNGNHSLIDTMYKYTRGLK
jgi:hypothetical protein